MGLGFYFEFD